MNHPSNESSVPGKGDPVIMNKPQPEGLVWFKSSFSNGSGGNNCVEIAHLDDGGVAVRNSRHPRGPWLAFTGDEWDSFLAGAESGEFNRPDRGEKTTP